MLHLLQHTDATNPMRLEQFVDEVDRLSRRLMRNLECCDRVLMADYQLTAAQAYSLLALQERGEVTMNQLASEMRLHGTTMTRMVDSLVEKGLAERRPDPEDRRLVCVRLTAQGEATVDQLVQCKRQFLAEAFLGLSESEQEVILRALRRLASTVEQLGARCCAC